MAEPPSSDPLPSPSPQRSRTSTEIVSAPDWEVLSRSLGKPFGRYRLIEEVGRGGMGIVWKAWDTGLRRIVALKQIGIGETNSAVLERFTREAQAAARLRHPLIAGVHDVGVEDGHPFFTADFIAGHPLDVVLAQGRLSSREGITLVMLAGEALQYAHDQGIVHRDIKPGNILVDKEGRPHIVDFGLAVGVSGSDFAGPGGRLTMSGALVGTPRYMSPEQASGRPEAVGPASDQFGLGVILYEVLTGQLPFDEENLPDIMRATIEADPVRPREIDASIDRDVETVCLKALEKDPLARYASVGEMSRDLGRILQGEPIVARPVSPARRLFRRLARHRTVLAPIVAALILAISVGAVLLRLQARKSEAALEEARRRADSLREGEESAEAALEKAQRVSAVLARWARLVPALKELEAAHYDSRRASSGTRTGLEGPWAEVEEFMRATPPDPASQSAMKALAGWARVLSGNEEEGVRWMREAAALDPEVPLGLLMEALLRFAWYVERQKLPLVSASRYAIVFAPQPPETSEMERVRRELTALLDKAHGARVWGKEGAEELQGALCAVLATQSGEYGLAEEELGKALSAANLLAFESGLRLARAKVRYLRKEFEPGLRDLDRVLEARPEQAEAHFYVGELNLGRAAEATAGGVDPRPFLNAAVAAYGKAMERDPHSLLICNSRGVAHRREGDVEAAIGGDPHREYALAITDFSAALGLAPSMLEARINRASAYVALGESEAAQGLDPRASYDVAVEDYAKAIEANPKFAGAHGGLGIAWQSRGEAEAARGIDPRPSCRKAIAAFVESLKLEPDSAWTLNNRGAAYERLGEAEAARGNDPGPSFANALADEERALARDPTLAVAHNNRALALQRQAESDTSHGKDARATLDRSIQEYDEALRLDTRYAEAHFARAGALHLRAELRESRGEDPTEDLDRAISDCDAALKLNPRGFGAYQNRANALAMKGRIEADHGGDPLPVYERAIADFGEGLRWNPQGGAALMGRSNTYVLRGQALMALGKDPRPSLDLAIADAGQALRNNPKFVEAFVSRGIAYHRRAEAEASHGDDPSGSYEKGIANFRSALGFNPQFWQANANLGKLYESMGRWDDAVAAYEEAVKIVKDGYPPLVGWLKAARAKAAREKSGGNR